MPQGGTLRITTESSGATVRTHFSDTGIGMSRQVCERVFEPFFTTKGAAGTGLGLAVSYSIIERHGGRLEARSNPGQGSTFTITLPVLECAHEELVINEAAPIKAGRILVIDDDGRVREALAEMLSSAGHIVERVGSASEGLARLETGSFNVVITDLSMPEMDGWAVAREIRDRWPSLKIVLITGFALTQDVVAQNAGLVDKVIFKPTRLDEISMTIAHILAEPVEQKLAVRARTPHQPTVN
jgi:CheY-like chemotaxis protein